MVRCPSCDARQSEWAARCSECGHDLTEALSIEPAPSTRPGRRPVVAVGLVAVVAVVIAVVAIASRHRSTSVSGAPPASTASTTSTTSGALSIKAGSRVEVIGVDPNGDLVRHDQRSGVRLATDVAGWPEGPAMVAGHLLYLSGGTVFDATAHAVVFPSLVLGRPQRGRPTQLTPVVGRSATGHGEVWVTSRVGDPSLSEADLLAYDGRVWTRTTMVTLPANEVVAAAFPGRLVTVTEGGFLSVGHRSSSVVERDSATGAVVLRLDDMVDGPSTRGSLIGATADVLAYLDCAEPDCPLVVQTSSATRRVHPPSGLGRFLPGGAVSPDGSIVVFAQRDGLLARLVLVDSRSTAMSVIDGDVTSGDPPGAAAWSPDGRVLVFGGFAETYAVDASRKVTRLPYVAGYGFIVTAP